MTTEQDTCDSALDPRVASYTAVIVDELRKRLVNMLMNMQNLAYEVNHRNLEISFEPFWFDDRFMPTDVDSPYELRNASMHAAAETFGDWFSELFGIKVRVRIESVDICDGFYPATRRGYTGIFTAYIRPVTPPADPPVPPAEPPLPRVGLRRGLLSRRR